VDDVEEIARQAQASRVGPYEMFALLLTFFFFDFVGVLAVTSRAARRPPFNALATFSHRGRGSF